MKYLLKPVIFCLARLALMYLDNLTSGMSLDSEHVHTVYGFAKDFALSGLAVGVYIRKTRRCWITATELAHFSRVSNYTQTLITHLLSDHAWVQSFLHQAQTRLTAAL